ncbi:hypothetical protein RvY_11145 [Ramazzottius varieornatus]|uniref:BTB domain-containing protein n=1 Tax=Ramazzottius varieornatus TaxID=947166 RepID=A0A1D1VF56_RAMVA|nr:hypothetical protein RvY_11145 [Ramazzottius varieornatus]
MGNGHSAPAAEEKKSTVVADASRDNFVRRLYDSDVGRDFILVSSEGEKRPVHKLILSVASPVFHRTYLSNLEECMTGRCVLKDITSATLEKLLRYAYYGSLEGLSKENAKDVLIAADKYELLEMKEACEDVLIKDIVTNNVSKLLFLSDRVSAEALKRTAVEYIAANAGRPSEVLNNIVNNDVELNSTLYSR